MGKKSKKKTGLYLLLGVLATTLIVGAVGALSEGFKNWDYKEWFDTREGLKKIDLRTSNNTQELRENQLLEILNGSNNDSDLFSEVTKISKVYQANGGLKFGTTDNPGNFTATFKDYEFDHVKIKVQAYSSFSEATNIYTVDNSTISVNEAAAKELSNNKEDTSKNVPIDEIEFVFDENQKELTIVSTKRLVIYEIEMWNDSKNDKNPGTSDSTGGNLSTDVSEDSGISLKFLKTETADGFITNTYTFTISPENATNKNVIATASYVDGTAYDDVVIVSVDNSRKELSLKTSETVGFSKQVKVVVSSESNPTVKSEILVDFKRKVNYINLDRYTEENGYVLGGEAGVNSFSELEDILEVGYSKYTVSESFTFQIESLNPTGDYFTSSLTGWNSSWNTTLGNFLDEKLMSGEIITQSEILNLISTNDWKSFLQKNSTLSGSNFFRAYEPVIVAYDSAHKEVKRTTLTVQDGVKFGINLNWEGLSSTSVGVDRITLESNKVIF